jgi:hypothetical protein
MWILWSIASAFAGCESGWTCTTVFTGTTSDSVAVATAIRVVAEDNEVFVAWERDDMSDIRNGPPITADHDVVTRVRHYSCNGECGSPSANATVTMSGSMHANDDDRPELGLISAGVWQHTASDNRLNIIQKTEEACSAPDSELHEVIFSSDTLDEIVDRDVDGSCDDRGWNDSVRGGSNLHQCATEHSGANDRVYCRSRGDASGTWGSAVNMSGGGLGGNVQEHGRMTIRNSKRLVVLHEIDGVNESIWLVFPDESPVVRLELETETHKLNFPWVALAANGDVLVGFLEAAGSARLDTLRMLKCDAAEDCDDIGDWSGETMPAAAYEMLRADYIVGDTGREFLLWNEVPGAGQEYEVKLVHRCPGGSWSSVLRPWTAASSSPNEDIQWGLPHLAFDPVDDVLHVVMLEAGGAANAREGDVIWARQTYPNVCP